MNKFKTIISLLLVILLAVSIIGCGSDSQDDSGEDEAQGIDTMARIQENNQIIWGTNAAFAPFEMRQGDDVIGVDAEIAARIAEKLGVELVVDDMDFEGLIPALTSGKIDFIAAGFTVKPDREQQVLFTDRYFEAVQVIIVRDDETEIQGPEDLADKKIGVQIATTATWVVEDILKDGTGEMISFNNGIEAVLDLKNGNIDAVIIDNLPAQYLVDANDGIVILDTKADEEEEYALAVRKGDEELAAVINEVLNELIAEGMIDAWVQEYSLN